MTLPDVRTLVDCADYAITVAPYNSQLTELPQRILESWSDIEALKAVYVSTNPLIFAFALSIFLAPIFLLISELNRNYSQVDRMWSILPTIYNAHFVIYSHMVGLRSQRLDTLLAFSCVWSLRLTFNYWRKGGYSIGSEDYRWEILRKYINAPLFFIFNVLFISLAQSLLLFSVTMPSYILLLTTKIPGNSAFSTGDLFFSRLLMCIVLFEFFADQQQWDFQQAKKSYQATAKVPFKYTAEDLDRGFIVSGLWSWSRHPNFAAEQLVWICLYQYACFTTDTYLNWTVVGPMCYVLLFQGSTWFTEWVSANKYPEYAEYQARVGMFLPRLGLEGPSEEKMKAVLEKVEAKRKQLVAEMEKKKKEESAKSK